MGCGQFTYSRPVKQRKACDPRKYSAKPHKNTGQPHTIDANRPSHVIVAIMFGSKSFTGAHGWYFCSLLSLIIAGCGSDSGKGNNSTASGQVTAAWGDYCTATFTKDVAISESYSDGDVAFTARAGEEYLLVEYGSFGTTPQVRIAYLTPSGPRLYDVPVTGGPETFPFTSNCTYNAAVEYYAAFTDVTVYDSESLTNAICTIPAGTAMARDTSTNAGYSAVTMNFSGPTTYNVMLNVFSTLCGGATEGYISVPETHVLGVTTWLVPIETILKAT